MPATILPPVQSGPAPDSLTIGCARTILTWRHGTSGHKYVCATRFGTTSPLLARRAQWIFAITALMLITLTSCTGSSRTLVTQPNGSVHLWKDEAAVPLVTIAIP